VYAGKPGLDRIVGGQFTITLAEAGDVNLTPYNWTSFLKRDMHIEQAMIVYQATSTPREGCPFPGCAGRTVLIGGGKRW
jgi:hypothetical protein